MVKLEDVFNEAMYPEITFVKPKEYPHILSAFRASGKHVTISGASGSGKTTLVKRMLKDLNINDSEVLFINGRSYIDESSILTVFSKIFECQNDFNNITKRLQEYKFIIIDDFHHLSSASRAELAKKLKLWHENNVRFIIIGIASSAYELVGHDAELGIRNDPFEMKTQDKYFVLELINLGENALDFSFSEKFKDDIVKASNGVPSIVHVICRTACIEAGISETLQGPKKVVDIKLIDLKESVLRIFTSKYFDKVVGLAKGKQQTRSIHNTYYDIVYEISKTDKSDIPIEYLHSIIIKRITDPKERSRKATSFNNCLNNLNSIIEEQKLTDIILYKKGANYIAIEDPSFRFYLNLIDMNDVKSKLDFRTEIYPYDMAVSFAGEMRKTVEKFVELSKLNGLEVFYDFDQQAQLWGQDLRKRLAEVYANEAIYMVVFLSETYPEKDWPSFELAIGKDASEKRTEEYLLPIRCDDVHIVGLKDTIGYMDIRKHSLEEIVQVLVNKIDLYNIKKQKNEGKEKDVLPTPTRTEMVEEEEFIKAIKEQLNYTDMVVLKAFRQPRTKGEVRHILKEVSDEPLSSKDANKILYVSYKKLYILELLEEKNQNVVVTKKGEMILNNIRLEDFL